MLTNVLDGVYWFIERGRIDMDIKEIVNSAKVNEEIKMGGNFVYSNIFIRKSNDGSFTWMMGFNQKLFQGNLFAVTPMTGRSIKFWKKESSARADLIKFLESTMG
jgi:hypothetical protein